MSERAFEFLIEMARVIEVALLGGRRSGPRFRCPSPLLLAFALFGAASLAAQESQLKTTGEVLDRYKNALGGIEVIRKVGSMTVRGEAESSDAKGKVTFVYYAKPFKSLFKLKRPNGAEVQAGFDGTSSWAVSPEGASLDKDTPLEAVRRDSDLQYPLHQPDYFRRLELMGVTDFEGHRCYWLNGTTKWGKDNNQFYDVSTGLLVGYRFESDDKSRTTTVALFEDYKTFGGPRIATRNTTRAGGKSQTFTYLSVSYDPLSDGIFELPDAVKRLLTPASH